MGRTTFSAGGVVVSSEGKILVVSQNGDSWSLPKGHIESGETAQQAAAREIREESGIHQLNLLSELGTYERYQIGLHGIGESDELKHITLFLYTTEEIELKPEDPRHPEARWVEPAKVADLLTHRKDKAFFEANLADIMSEIKKM